VSIIVGITGATGSIYGVRLLEELKALDVETDLIITDWGRETIRCETGMSVEQVEKLATRVHDNRNLAATISSGSHPTKGMVIAPCSMKTLSGIAHSYNDDLMIRSADVVLKERRRLILLARETPLNLSHIENMKSITLMGGIIMPPVPAFYSRPQSIDELVDQTVGRVLDLLCLDAGGLIHRWSGGTTCEKNQ